MRGSRPGLAVTLGAAFVLVMHAAAAHAQMSGLGRAIVMENAPITVLPDASRAPLRTAATGTSLVILADQGDWLQVQFQDPQFGLRVGYIQKKFVSIPSAALQPVDLSVPTTPDGTAAPGVQPAPAPPATQQPLPSVARPATPNRVFIDVNWMSVRPFQETQTFTATTQQFGEQATATATYPDLPTLYGWDLNGSVRLKGQWGVGMRALWAEFKLPAVLGVRLPHPFFLNRFASDMEVTDRFLLRDEKIFDFHAMYSYNAPHVRIVGFGGPSYFRLSHEMVESVLYLQSFNVVPGTNAVSITAFNQADISGSAWGLNAGADASYFLSRSVGLGGGIRVNSGTVTINDPLSRSQADLHVGSITFVAGPRFRF